MRIRYFYNATSIDMAPAWTIEGDAGVDFLLDVDEGIEVEGFSGLGDGRGAVLGRGKGEGGLWILLVGWVHGLMGVRGVVVGLGWRVIEDVKF